MTQIECRTVTGFEQLQAIVELQLTAWPAEMVTPAAQLTASTMHGGVVVAAYDGGYPVGFCYGFAAYDGRRPYLHSHMMAVRPEYRDRGIGRQLKLAQRQWAIDYGYATMTWTYDPFVVRNGYLNLCKLAGKVAVYLPSVYGDGGGSRPSDRFLVQWDLLSADVCAAADGRPRQEQRWCGYPVLSGDAADEGSALEQGGDGFLLAVTAGVDAEPRAATGRLRQWCELAFARSWHIVGWTPGDTPDGYYVLERNEDDGQRLGSAH